MSDERLAEIRREWVTDPSRLLSTHSDGCWSYHPGCAVAALLAEVDRLRALLGVLHPGIAACAEAVLAEELPAGWKAEVRSFLFAMLLGPEREQMAVHPHSGIWSFGDLTATTLAGIIEAVTQ
jgi:hypothetical protein